MSDTHKARSGSVDVSYFGDFMRDWQDDDSQMLITVNAADVTHLELLYDRDKYVLPLEMYSSGFRSGMAPGVKNHDDPGRTVIFQKDQPTSLQQAQFRVYLYFGGSKPGNARLMTRYEFAKADWLRLSAIGPGFSKTLFKGQGESGTFQVPMAYYAAEFPSGSKAEPRVLLHLSVPNAKRIELCYIPAAILLTQDPLSSMHEAPTVPMTFIQLDGTSSFGSGIAGGVIVGSMTLFDSPIAGGITRAHLAAHLYRAGSQPNDIRPMSAKAFDTPNWLILRITDGNDRVTTLYKDRSDSWHAGVFKPTLSEH